MYLRLLISSVLILVSFYGCGAEIDVSPKVDSDRDHPAFRDVGDLNTTTVRPSSIYDRVKAILFGYCKLPTLYHPSAIAVDNNGSAYVVDAIANRVVVYPDGDDICQDVEIFGQDYFEDPFGIALSKNRIFVSDIKRVSILIFDRSFNYLDEIEYSEFVHPGQIHYSDYLQKLYIADPRANRIFVLDDQTKNISSIDGTYNREFHFPQSVCTSPDSNIYVLDALNRKVTVHDQSGEFLFEFGEFGIAPGMLAYPKSLTINSTGLVFVADPTLKNVQIYSPKGRLLLILGKNFCPGNWLSPTTMYFDSNNKLYLLDPFSQRIKILEFFKW